MFHYREWRKRREKPAAGDRCIRGTAETDARASIGAGDFEKYRATGTFPHYIPFDADLSAWYG
ncbi:hypothetical protein CH63R_06072 [Colletotrichum higginsianum IMI 349063]|uniref:Uncharacterized protein n=1 Tax=Colletotrichum higginsianum (strain IMI 349063) TaxID=759273 RepID=A0A1B7YEM5_COLHI|nr:hypothetical protein CH63R_06072 [Colletotrichum higginsianum IMI 349063]OBR10380.1 hypothetical protein CH63R_06072 [Colletotrichum higginsianum IMI 349063]